MQGNDALDWSWLIHQCVCGFRDVALQKNRHHAMKKETLAALDVVIQNDYPVRGEVMDH
jgi:hypothetical protein